jgi:hypothetical protein
LRDLECILGRDDRLSIVQFRWLQNLSMSLASRIGIERTWMFKDFAAVSISLNFKTTLGLLGFHKTPTRVSAGSISLSSILRSG